MAADPTYGRIVRFGAAAAGLIGLAGLAGWLLDMPGLRRVLPGAVEMKANTAIGLVVAGAGLGLCGFSTRPALAAPAVLLALLLATLGLATGGQYVYGWQLGIDELLFRDRAQAYNAIPGRMSPYSALGFAAIGVSLAVLPAARLRPLSRLAAAVVLLVGVVSLLGYAWNASEIVTDDLLPPVALNTALAFVALGLGALCAAAQHSSHRATARPRWTEVEFRIAAAFVGAFLLLIIGGGITYRTSAEYVRTAQSVAHTQEVRALIGQLHAAVADAESAARTYVLTGADRYRNDFVLFGGASRRHAADLNALVDDDPFALKLLGRQLELLGCDELTLCGSAQDAIVLLEQQGERVDLVFCDLQMPGLDGVEFVRHLARIGYRGGLVLVSGEEERALLTVRKLAQAHRMQVLGALQKPVSQAQLRQLLDHRPPRPASPPAAAPVHGADELARAIAAGELVNHYQPKVDLATGALVGVEALVRWQHPSAGLVYPDRFIATAESHGLVDALTHAVLVEALRQLRAWQQQGLALQMAVNVSMDSLAALDFPDRVARLAADAGVALSNLTLEVTESRLMRDSRASLEILTRLRLKRITLSIDDFGTGHSSLAQLRDIPFDELKLDRGFIDGVSRDAALRAIVEATLAMARQLGIKSVAEGVETRADWDLLRRLGCDVAQGYLVGRPLPGQALPDWRAAWELRRPELLAPAA